MLEKYISNRFNQNRPSFVMDVTERATISGEGFECFGYLKDINSATVTIVSNVTKDHHSDKRNFPHNTGDDNWLELKFPRDTFRVQVFA